MIVALILIGLRNYAIPILKLSRQHWVYCRAITPVL